MLSSCSSVTNVLCGTCKIAQALARVKTPRPPAANSAAVKAAAGAGAAARTSVAAAGAALGPGSHPWPPVTDDASLRDLWSRYNAELVSLGAGFDRLLEGVTGTLNTDERKARSQALGTLLDEYRKAWKVMLSRLTGAKGMTAYAGCRGKMIAHANGVRARDRLVVRLVSAVRRGQAVGIKRADAAQRAQGAKNRRLAAAVRTCLKSAGEPAPGGRRPEEIPVRLDLSSICPKKVVRTGVPLVLVDGPQADYTFACHYALPTNRASVPVTVKIIWWTPTSGAGSAVGNCAQGTDRLSGTLIREWASGTYYLDVQGAGGFDDRDAILKRTLDDAVARMFALPCDYNG